MYLNKNKISILLAKNVKSGRIIHVEEAEKGLNCNCICLKCGEQLKAMKGDIKSWHFSHHTDSDCGGAQETALHHYVKLIILEHNTIII